MATHKQQLALFSAVVAWRAASVADHGVYVFACLLRRRAVALGVVILSRLASCKSEAVQSGKLPWPFFLVRWRRARARAACRGAWLKGMLCSTRNAWCTRMEQVRRRLRGLQEESSSWLRTRHTSLRGAAATLLGFRHVVGTWLKGSLCSTRNAWCTSMERVRRRFRGLQEESSSWLRTRPASRRGAAVTVLGLRPGGTRA